MKTFFFIRWTLSLLLVGMAVGQAAPLQMKYLGAAGWEMKAGELVVLVDPYISRVKYGAGRDVKDGRKSFADTDLLASDTKLIDSLIPKADYILIHHAHPDHILDVPYIAKKTGARVLGTETSINILRAYGVPEEQLYPVQGGEDYQFDGWSVRVVPSLHSALIEKRYFDPRRYGEDLKAPLRLLDLAEGGSLMFLCRLAGREVLTMGSMNFIERELQGLRPDILLAGSGTSRTEIYKYTERLLNVTGLPRVVIPTHWDNFY
ncbi:MBL fold metallo-hydrolase, partial [Steroidobacter sp.]|uniref:MBL fold metallo-hydrolase n=1 Tax=Steroidobacter sp. TaxID=1978227 RepID=UPI001A4978E7